MNTNQNDFTQDNPPVMSFPLLYVEKTGGRFSYVYHFHYADTDTIGKTIKKTITDYDDTNDGHDWVHLLIKPQLEQGGTQIRNANTTYYFFVPMIVPKTSFTPKQKEIMEDLLLQFHKCHYNGVEPYLYNQDWRDSSLMVLFKYGMIELTNGVNESVPTRFNKYSSKLQITKRGQVRMEKHDQELTYEFLSDLWERQDSERLIAQRDRIDHQQHLTASFCYHLDSPIKCTGVNADGDLKSATFTLFSPSNRVLATLTYYSTRVFTGNNSGWELNIPCKSFLRASSIARFDVNTDIESLGRGLVDIAELKDSLETQEQVDKENERILRTLKDTQDKENEL